METHINPGLKKIFNDFTLHTGKVIKVIFYAIP